MADSIFVPTNNMGFEAYLSDLGVVPTVADFLAEIRSVTGLGFSVQTVDATSVTSKDGFVRQAPTLIEGKPMTVTLYKENSNYTKVSDKFLNFSTSDSKFYCDLTLIFPKTDYNQDVPNYVYSGFISDFSQGDVDATQLQTFSFVFTPTKKPRASTAVIAPPEGV